MCIRDRIRDLHKENLDKSPFKKHKKLTKSERKELQLPPNAYNDRIWELTMDPVLGRPKTENLFQIQEDLKLMAEIEFKVCREKTLTWHGFQEDQLT